MKRYGQLGLAVGIMAAITIAAPAAQAEQAVQTGTEAESSVHNEGPTEPTVNDNGTWGVDWVTYCGWPDVADKPAKLYSPIRQASPPPDKIISQGDIHCSPARLIQGEFVIQLQKKGPYGNYQNYGSPATHVCDSIPGGGPSCPLDMTLIDWAYCNESGWYRTLGSITGQGGNPPSWNHVSRASYGKYIYCP